MSAAVFSSRWVRSPAHVTELSDRLPAGFRAAGVACGLKPSGGRDLGLLVSTAVDTVSAARFTRSGVLAAPVVLTKERARLDAIRVVVANSGNANAATGRRGFEEAARMQGAAAMAGGVREDQVAVASTGVIGVLLEAGDVIRGIARARGELRDYGHGDFSEAIQTTDKFPKEVEVDERLLGRGRYGNDRGRRRTGNRKRQLGQRDGRGRLRRRRAGNRKQQLGQRDGGGRLWRRGDRCGRRLLRLRERRQRSVHAGQNERRKSRGNDASHHGCAHSSGQTVPVPTFYGEVALAKDRGTSRGYVSEKNAVGTTGTTGTSGTKGPWKSTDVCLPL